MTGRSIAAVPCALLVGCAPALQRYEYTRVIMAAPARIVVHAETEAAALDAARDAFDRLNELDRVMSDYRRDSELSLLCARAGEPAIGVSADLHRVLTLSAQISAATDGAFDVTVGPVVALWREARATERRPEADDLGRARDLVGWQRVVLDDDPPRVTLERSGMRLDLGGIGKGFAADEALAVLAGHGLRRCLVDLGGDLVAGDPPPGRAAWRVDVDSGLAGEPRTIDLVRGAVATSGDREQSVVIDGRLHSHLVDPRTGMALQRRIAVTVAAPDGATADALASALSVLGPDGLSRLDGFPGTRAWVEIEDMTEAPR